MQCLRWYGAVFVLATALISLSAVPSSAAEPLRVATFCCDVTPPLGEPMFSCDDLKTVEQPLLAKGIVIESGGERYVLCAVDYCQLCDSSHDGWRKTIAAAAGAKLAHVAVQCVHQHTAPLVDRDAQKLLAEAGLASAHVDPKALDEIETRLAAAVRSAVEHFEPFDRIGTGQAKVERVASSRRIPDAGGNILVRFSYCRDPAIRAMPEGRIDPYLKTITLARGDRPLVRLHYYATHPQSKYGDHRASSDFPGHARETLQKKEGVFQIYFTGCGGDITVGKYNDATTECSAELATRLLAGMEASVAATSFAPAGPIRWRTYPLALPRRADKGYNLADCLARLKDPKVLPVVRLYGGAVRVAFHERAGQPIELSSLEMGNVHIVHLPGEPLVDFQFFAQKLRPAEFVAVAGYGDCGPGYICPAKACRDGGYEPSDSCVTPAAEELMKKAITALLGAND
jgi:hypothetical protein